MNIKIGFIHSWNGTETDVMFIYIIYCNCLRGFAPNTQIRGLLSQNTVYVNDCNLLIMYMLCASRLVIRLHCTYRFFVSHFTCRQLVLSESKINKRFGTSFDFFLSSRKASQSTSFVWKLSNTMSWLSKNSFTGVRHYMQTRTTLFCIFLGFTGFMCSHLNRKLIGELITLHVLLYDVAVIQWIMSCHKNRNMVNKILNSWSFHMKFMKLAEGQASLINFIWNDHEFKILYV